MTQHNDTLYDMNDPFAKKFPIIQQPEENGGITYIVYIFEEIGEPRDFTELLSVFDVAESNDRIILKLNTPGGQLDSTISILDGIANTSATVIAEIVGDVASAGTIIALACHGFYVAPHSEFMCHNFSGGLYGKGHELKARSKFMHNNIEDLMRKTYHKFLTRKEIESLIKGEDFYFGKEEVEERLNRLVEYRQKKQDKEAKRQEDDNDESMIEYLESKGYKLK